MLTQPQVQAWIKLLWCRSFSACSATTVGKALWETSSYSNELCRSFLVARWTSVLRADSLPP
jgi:hypothetical protein